MSGPRDEQPREHEEAAALLATGAARARAGDGGLVLVRGATGTGRTTVLEAAAEEAAAHGMRVLRVRCAPGDAAVPFAAVLRLLDREAGCASFGPAGGEREQAGVLWHVLRSYADESPLLVAVDDVHLADAPSHRWLVESARRIGRSAFPVLLAVTERSQYDVDPPPPRFTHTLSRAFVHTHTLAPFTAGAAAAVVRGRFSGAPRRWIEGCVRASAGSPLLLRALLEDLDGLDPGHRPVPETTAALYPGAYPAAVSWWLDSAGPGTAEVARALAALDEGRERTVDGLVGAGEDGLTDGVQELGELLAELAGADPGRVAGWLTAMTGLGLLRTGPGSSPRYAHPLLREAILTGVPAAWRRDLHQGAAEVMLRRGASTETVARQLLLSGPSPAGETWTPCVLQDAASLAVRDGRVDAAAAYLRRALDEPLPVERRQQLLTQLGSLDVATPGSSSGIPWLTEALRLPAAPQDRVRAAVALGTALTGRGEARAAVEMLRSLGAQFADRPGLLGTLHSASALLSDRDQTVRREVYAWLCETAERVPEVLGPAVRVLLVRYAATAGRTSALEAMRQVRELLAEPAEPLTEPFLLGTAATIAQWADELDEAERLVGRGLASQRSHMPHPMHEALLNAQADIVAARGAYSRPLGEPPALKDAEPTNVHAHTLIALVELGHTQEARRFADGFDLGDAPDSWELNRFLYARGVQRAAAGDPAGALHDFLECGRRQSAREVVSPVVTPWSTAAAECCLALGRPQEALALAEEELRLARVWGTPRTMGRALRVLGTATGGHRGLKLAEDAVRLLRPASPGTGPELVVALIAQGRQLTAAGERVWARECLREAAGRAERLGAVRLGTLAEDALREGGARRVTARTGTAALTDSERRVAQLAAEGRTNSEIADLLHLARRTVETHLTNSYRKLGIRRRTQLGEALGRGTAPLAEGAGRWPLRR
ncbi:LuxR C-terminal-related transcriptional regulator [Streptomyces sp. NRRL S-813]|uniref:LuxR C-terminal-related transcriptional regulator n=1 Tax=Streptomyces sp. NRRL S-813 TaxID=1463919 RepID=UPI00099B4863|nr:LuxR C-terminal-related transcriptional regulator [Streptomyces sp. NRRL S-813]